MEFRKVKLKECVNILKKTENPQRNANKEYILYSLPAFDNKKIPEICKGKNINSNKIIINGDVILFNKLNLRFKRIWNVWLDDSKNNVCSTEFIPLEIKEKGLDKNYLYYLLLSDEFNKKLMEASTGTSNSHQRIQKEFLLDQKICLPNISEQKKIVKILKSIDDKIQLNNQINDNLAYVA